MVFSFIRDYWLIALILLLSVLLFQVVARSMFRLISIFLVIGVVMVLVFNYTPDQVIQMGRSMVQSTNEAFKTTVLPVIEAEMKDATYQFHEDGTYEMRTSSVRIVGKKGESKATVYYKGTPFEVDISQFTELIQEQLKKANVTPATSNLPGPYGFKV